MRAFWGMVLAVTAGVAQAAGLRAVHVLDAGDATRVVLETPARAPYHVFTLANPDRVVVDLRGVRANQHLVNSVAARGVVRSVRESPQKDGVRIVFDVTGPVTSNSFVMSPSGAFGNRVIVDLVPQEASRTPVPIAADATSKAVPTSVSPQHLPPSTPVANGEAVLHPVARGRAVTPSPLLPDPKAPPSAPPQMAVAAPPVVPAPVTAAVAAAAPAVSVAPQAQVASAPAPAQSVVGAAPSGSRDANGGGDGPSAGSEAEDAAALAAAAAASAARAPVAPTPALAPVRVVRSEAPAMPARAREVRAVHGSGKPIVVAIDAGHGGHDPGAIGFAGVQEKDVCLAMARKLAALVDAQPGMHAVLTRDGDYFVELRERMVKARAAQADVFVSIHANSYRERSTRGAAVYALSAHGASSEQARWLANHENAADLVGGVDLQGRDEKVAAVLLDISQSATMEASFDLAGRMLDSLQEVTEVEKPEVQQAGFMVLKAPDIPSILIETAFITNAEEERALASEDFENQMAHAMLRGLVGYFDNYRPQQPAPAVQTAQRISAASP